MLIHRWIEASPKAGRGKPELKSDVHFRFNSDSDQVGDFGV